MCSFITEAIVQKLSDENKRLSEELSFIREKQKVFNQLKITFDLYSNKIKQSLESNEWQKFEKLLIKINTIKVNEFVKTREKLNNKSVVDVNTHQTRQPKPHEVSYLFIHRGAISFASSAIAFTQGKSRSPLCLGESYCISGESYFSSV